MANEAKSDIVEFYRGRNVLITGATGFIGKQVMEKLLRSCPDINSIYVLMRASRSATPQQRLRTILQSTLCEKLRSLVASQIEGVVGSEKEEKVLEMLERKIRVITADISQRDLGISAEDRKDIISNISVVIHLAATVSFNEPMRVAVNLNISALRSVMDLCKEMKNLDSFVHVSTAYANCDRPHIAEVVYPPPLQPAQILDAADWMSDSMFNDITSRVIEPRPNTYTFTKAIAEQLLIDECGSLPVAIFRPSIVTATVREPIPGWIDNLNGCTGVLTAIGGGFIRAIYGIPEKRADLVPVDLVANAVIATAFQTGMHKRKEGETVPVYNFTSGHMANHLHWVYVGNKTNECFHRHPLENHAWIPKGYVTTNRIKTFTSLYVDVYIRMMGIDLVRRLLGKKPRMVRIHKSVCKMAHLMEYFTSREWTWDYHNISALYNSLSEHDKQVFGFDVNTIHWSSYFDNYCLGIRQHLMKQQMKSLPQSRRLLRAFIMVRRVAMVSTLFFIARLLIARAETASRLWKFLMGFVRSLVQRFPRAIRA